MLHRWALATLHLLALGIGLGWTKMGLLFAILALELTPIITLSRWRRAPKGEPPPDLHLAPTLARLSHAQLILLLCMLLVATGMARGAGG